MLTTWIRVALPCILCCLVGDRRETLDLGKCFLFVKIQLVQCIVYGIHINHAAAVEFYLIM